jgi:hypothetical protein
LIGLSTHSTIEQSNPSSQNEYFWPALLIQASLMHSMKDLSL